MGQPEKHGVLRRIKKHGVLRRIKEHGFSRFIDFRLREQGLLIVYESLRHGEANQSDSIRTRYWN